MPPSYTLRYFSDEFRMTTWLIIGASLQSLLLTILPIRVAIAPSLMLLLGRVIKFFLIWNGHLPDSSRSDVSLSRYTAQIPHADGSFSGSPSDQQIVVMIIGARSSHAHGRFAPGYKETGDRFWSMWKDLEDNPEQYGYLGKSSTLLETDTDCENTEVWISYWKSLRQLREFAVAKAHREAWDVYNQQKSTHSHIGVLHEIYAVPKGYWETIYLNIKPFGLAQARCTTKDGDIRGTILEAKGSAWKDMSTRMSVALNDSTLL